VKALECLASINQAAFDLLRVCSFFPAEPIPRQLLAAAPSVSITDELEAALADRFRSAVLCEISSGTPWLSWITD
jgi:hypothetical protein